MSSVVRIDVDGVNVNADGAVSALSLDGAINERVKFSFVLDDYAGTPPAIDDEVIVYYKDGTTQIQGGLVADITKIGVSENNPNADVLKVDCVDWERFTDWCSVSLSYAVPVALEDVIDDMITAAFGAYGLTYTPTATGVTLAPFTWVNVKGNAAVRELRDRTGLIFTFNADKSITTAVAGATPGLFAITDANLYRLAKFETGTKARERANKVILSFGPTGPGEVIEHTWIADGVATSFSLEGLNIHASDVWPGIVTIDGTPYPIWPAGEGGADSIEWANAVDDGTLTFNGAFTAYIPNGAVIVLRYSPLFPFTIERTAAGSPPREYRDSNASIIHYDVGGEIADQVLARLSQSVDGRVLSFVTDEFGFGPGQALSVNTTARGGVVADFLVASVSVEVVTAEYWLFTVTATEGDLPQISYQGEWGQITNGGGSGGGGNLNVQIAVSGEGVAWTNIGATAWGVGTGFFREYNGGAPRIRFGSVAGNRFVYDENGDLTLVSQRLTIDANGVTITPDATARDEVSSFRFGNTFGLYGTAASGKQLDLLVHNTGFTNPPSIINIEVDSDDPVSRILLKSGSAGNSITLTSPSIVFDGPVTIGTATYPGTATPSGAYLRADGTNWITSTLILPNAITAGQVVFGSATNTYGASANLSYDSGSGVLTALATSGRHEVDPLGSFIYRHSNTANASPDISLRRSRGTTPGTPAAVDVDDSLGSIRWRGHDGTGYIVGASIEALIDDTVATNDLATRLEFGTTPPGASSPVVTVTLDSQGKLRLHPNTSTDVQWGDEGDVNPHYAGDDDFGFTWFMLKSRGDVTAPTIVNDGDSLGRFEFLGYDGAGHIQGAYIGAIVDGTPGTDDMPTALVFGTTPVGGASAIEGMRLGTDQVLVLAEPLPGASGGTGYTSVKAAGISTTLSTSYINGTGTSGADNTNQIVKTIVVAADTLTQVGDRLKITVHWRPNTGTAIVGRLAFNGTTVGTGVTVGTATSGTGTAEMVTSVILEYLTSTTANIWSYTGTGAFDATTSAANQGSFAWTSAQNISLEQSLIANNNITVFSLVAEVWPMGVVAA